MKNIKVLFALLTILLLSGCGYKEEVKLKELTITFDSNPSTGYNWEKETYTEGTVKIEESYESNCSDDVVGCGGKTIFKVTPLREGSEVIDFSYIAPDGETEKYNATYYITVDKDLNIKEDTHNGSYFNKSK